MGMLKQNQLKAERFAKALKTDLTNSVEDFTSITDTLELTKAALREVQLSLQANYVALRTFEVQLNNLRTEIEAKVKKYADFQRKMKMGKKLNPFILKAELQSVYTDNMVAGVGLIVISKMYDSIFSFMSNLDPCPVGLYDPQADL